MTKWGEGTGRGASSCKCEKRRGSLTHPGTGMSSEEPQPCGEGERERVGTVGRPLTRDHRHTLVVVHLQRPAFVLGNGMLAAARTLGDKERTRRGLFLQ